MIGRRGVAALLVVSALGAAESVAAQPAVDGLTEAQRGPDLTSVLVSRTSGLLSRTVYAIARAPDGRYWLGTQDGPYVSAGAQWRLQPLPRAGMPTQVRAILFDSAGGRWYATREGAHRYHDGRWTSYGVGEGVPAPVVYAMTETRALDGAARVVLATSNGACVVRGARCDALELPTGFPREALTTASTRDADGVDELWLASSSGGAARFRRGQWRVFGPADGFVSSSAEHIAFSADGRTVFIAGQGGVFSLSHVASGAERFAEIPGSPTGAYRVSWVPRATGRDELWVGTNNGEVLRWRDRQWDSLLVDGERIRGQVTLLHSGAGMNDSLSVWLGTRGSRLAELRFGPAVAFRLPGRAFRDHINAIAQIAEPAFRGQAVIGTVSVGAVFVDSLGRMVRFAEPNDPRIVSASTTYWGPLHPAPAGVATKPESTHVIVVGTGGAMLSKGAGWEPLKLPPQTSVRRIRRVAMLDGTMATVALTSRGLFTFHEQAWEPMPGREMDATDLWSTRQRGEAVHLITARGGVYAVSASGTRFEPVVGDDSAQSEYLMQVCEVPTADGGVLFVESVRGVVAWRPSDGDGVWRALPAAMRNALADGMRVYVRCDPSGRVLMGSSNGLLVTQVPRTDTASWTIQALLGREDGLPSNVVTAIGVPFNDRVWVGTEFGVAIAELQKATLPPVAPLRFRVIDDPRADPLPDGQELPASHDQLRVDVWLDEDHRAEDARFLIEWVPESRWPWPLRRGTISADTSWSEVSTRFVTGITPGTYRLRVRARDFAGREPAPVEWHVRIRPPAWQSGPAIAAYVLMLGGVLLALYRWRVGVIQQGTDRLVASEARLRESEGKFRALFDHSLDAHLICERGWVVGANAVAASLFSVPDRSHLIGRSIDGLLPVDASLPPTARPLELLIARDDADSVPVQLTVTSIVTEAGELRHLVLRDLTEVRAAERARDRIEAHLRERQRLESLGTLAGGVAHDFNNLLGVIRGNAELAGMESGEGAREHLDSIVDASDRARDLVRQILTFSRSPLPREELVDMSALLLSVHPLLRRMIPSSIEIVLEGTDRPHVVDGDPTQLQQILINLASNAEYAMRNRTCGTLTMSVHEGVCPEDGPPPLGPVVHLTVRDTGVGMSAEVRDRIFEPFFTTKPTGEGTGLGMAVLHGVVVAHGGRVLLESAPDVGTVVDVILPRSRGVATPRGMDAIGHATDRPATTVSGGSRVMIVDDEPAVARVFARALMRAGHSVQVYADPAEALAVIERRWSEFDLLLTDQTMPGVTGDVLAERARAVAPGVPVLILTGFSHRLTPERVAEVGAHAVLQKPMALDVLVDAVGEALRSVGKVG